MNLRGFRKVEQVFLKEFSIINKEGGEGENGIVPPPLRQPGSQGCITGLIILLNKFLSSDLKFVALVNFSKTTNCTRHTVSCNFVGP
jgi:hypothetical protein